MLPHVGGHGSASLVTGAVWRGTAAGAAAQPGAGLQNPKIDPGPLSAHNRPVQHSGEPTRHTSPSGAQQRFGSPVSAGWQRWKTLQQSSGVAQSAPAPSQISQVLLLVHRWVFSQSQLPEGADTLQGPPAGWTQTLMDAQLLLAQTRLPQQSPAHSWRRVRQGGGGGVGKGAQRPPRQVPVEQRVPLRTETHLPR